MMARSLLAVALGAARFELGVSEEPSARVWARSRQTITDFEVAGVNLARWFGEEHQDREAAAGPDAEPFQLYEDFDINSLVNGTENWYDLLSYRRHLQRPSLSFYVDKVARKRWLPSKGFSQARQYLLSYAHELTTSGGQEDEQNTILELLPREASYAAKPAHMSMTKGVLLVKHDPKNGTTRTSQTAMEMTERKDFDPRHIAEKLARQLHKTAEEEGEDAESWALRNVRPGVVVEELFVDTDHVHRPPSEFNVFTIWGRVWIAQWNFVSGNNRWIRGFFHRNGTRVKGTSENKEIPAWVDWQQVLDIAERLGRHKDMFRVDIFVGVPAGSPEASPEASERERQAAAQYAVSESEIYPTTVFVDKQICAEGARLWMAGYKVGNYRLVPNTEVPAAFLDSGSCSPTACSS